MLGLNFSSSVQGRVVMYQNVSTDKVHSPNLLGYINTILLILNGQEFGCKQSSERTIPYYPYHFYDFLFETISTPMRMQMYNCDRWILQSSLLQTSYKTRYKWVCIVSNNMRLLKYRIFSTVATIHPKYTEFPKTRIMWMAYRIVRISWWWKRLAHWFRNTQWHSIAGCTSQSVQLLSFTWSKLKPRYCDFSLHI